ncbi:transcriptional regulator [Saccharomonospora marina XMU15]|uniref:Transcriptional regulator n=1 Tax=Saccharomonospora marina XMU15 TaxID=882083 RepID=H5X0P7_9PSEU|nr:TetR/AcrR family transcriptional regulator [Saccharomonospora marina]EHR50843.1 transcriptional regulator [Saccharomonospora marina XMU15]
MLNTSTGQSARDRLLTVAERLFLESGYDKVSVRAINTAAGMNPAAVHYHFGSKDALVAALLESRMAPVWQDRLSDLLERRDQGWTPAVAELVDVVLTPLADLTADPIGRLHVQLLARFVLGRSELEWTSRWFSLQPWVALLRAARPDLSGKEAARRWILAFDLILQSFGAPLTTFGAVGSSGTAHVDTVRAFVTAGLDAP